MLWRSPPYVAFLVCRIERENSSAAWDSDRRRLSVHIELREKVPSSRFDLSNTGIWGAMFFSTRSVCGIRGEPLRRESEALLRSFHHGLRRTDLQILRAIVVPRLPIDRQA